MCSCNATEKELIETTNKDIKLVKAEADALWLKALMGGAGGGRRGNIQFKQRWKTDEQKAGAAMWRRR